MNLNAFKVRSFRQIAGVLVVLAYGVVMALTANHALTQAAPVPQRSWGPAPAKAQPMESMDQNSSSVRPNARVASRIVPLASNEVRSVRVRTLSGLMVFDANPVDALHHPWPHTGEFVDDCSGVLADAVPTLVSM